jgi:hypothetical protein
MNKPTRLIAKCALLMAFIFTSVQAVAEIYKWTDESGRVHYSDKKPAQENFNEMRVSTGTGTPGTQTSAANPGDNAQNSNKEQELQAKAEALSSNGDSEELDRKCAALRDNLAKLQNDPRIRINDGGEMRFLTPEEIEEKKAQFEQMLQANCQG